jgi:D-alanyl-lipoteichoic acid acyltransferase DltB (MBOAT superfamily)
MLFNTFQFLFFFSVVYTLYCALSHRWQNRLLLAASYVFYAGWDYRFCGLMLLTTVGDYFFSHRLHRADSDTSRKRWLWCSLALNLGILGFFKYFNFFADSVCVLLQRLGLPASPVSLSVILPVGVSFYTFQEMSYVIDVYRRRIKPVETISEFALFVSFFPQLVAGPIERCGHMLGQIQNPRRLTWEGCGEGLTLVLIGLFKKVAIADTLAGFAEPMFTNPAACSTGALFFGLCCFSFQIYSDFSGYTDIARGVARLMGFELMENFNQPYFSASITEFWRRWHISLSTWLRDYLYIPLGGNRHGIFNTYRNLFLTMLLGGLWHGASWNFVIWGALHGVFLALHKYMLGARKPAEPAAKKSPADQVLFFGKMLFTFHLVALTWVFFRAATFADACAYLRGLCGMARGPATVTLDTDALAQALASIAALLFLIDLPQYLRRNHCAMLAWPYAGRVLGFSCLLIWLIMTRGTESVPFIYFQF